MSSLSPTSPLPPSSATSTFSSNGPLTPIYLPPSLSSYDSKKKKLPSLHLQPIPPFKPRHTYNPPPLLLLQQQQQNSYPAACTPSTSTGEFPSVLQKPREREEKPVGSPGLGISLQVMQSRAAGGSGAHRSPSPHSLPHPSSKPPSPSPTLSPPHSTSPLDHLATAASTALSSLPLPSSTSRPSPPTPSSLPSSSLPTQQLLNPLPTLSTSDQQSLSLASKMKEQQRLEIARRNGTSGKGVLMGGGLEGALGKLKAASTGRGGDTGDGERGERERGREKGERERGESELAKRRGMGGDLKVSTIPAISHLSPSISQQQPKTAPATRVSFDPPNGSPNTAPLRREREWDDEEEVNISKKSRFSNRGGGQHWPSVMTPTAGYERLGLSHNSHSHPPPQLQQRGVVHHRSTSSLNAQRSPLPQHYSPAHTNQAYIYNSTSYPPSGSASNSPYTPSSSSSQPPPPPQSQQRFFPAPSPSPPAPPPQQQERESSKAGFLNLFSTFYDSLSDSRVLSGTLQGQIGRAEVLLRTLQDSGSVFESLLNKRLSSYSEEISCLDRRVLRSERGRESLEERFERLERRVGELEEEKRRGWGREEEKRGEWEGNGEIRGEEGERIEVVE